MSSNNKPSNSSNREEGVVTIVINAMTCVLALGAFSATIYQLHAFKRDKRVQDDKIAALERTAATAQNTQADALNERRQHDNRLNRQQVHIERLGDRITEIERKVEHENHATMVEMGHIAQGSMSIDRQRELRRNLRNNQSIRDAISKAAMELARSGKREEALNLLFFLEDIDIDPPAIKTTQSPPTQSQLAQRPNSDSHLPHGNHRSDSHLPQHRNP